MQDKTFKSIALAAIVCALFFPVSDSRADSARGADLYANHCQSCHAAGIHTREHSLKSRVILRAWVDAWSRHVGLGWNEGDVDDVTEYLDQQYYRFR